MTDRDGGPAFPIKPQMNGATADRFLRYVDVRHPDHCWPWTGCKTPKGYGIFALTHSKQVRAHRYAFHLARGWGPKHLCLHYCDNPACVNPRHLMDGTHRDNMRQMARRRRAAREERHHKAKLVVGEVVAIHGLLRAGYTTREVAALFGMHQSTIAAISTGQLWPDIKQGADALIAEREKRDG